MKQYKYIGPKELLKLVSNTKRGKVISEANDVISWIKERNQELNAMNQVIATFIIDMDNRLLVADRHSEHVACAGGENILSAGEMTFELNGNNVEIVHVTNQ
jgi:hypothetical protein